MGLSAASMAAIPEAVQMIDELIAAARHGTELSAAA
jgi:hypothetical protein